MESGTPNLGQTENKPSDKQLKHEIEASSLERDEEFQPKTRQRDKNFQALDIL